MINSIKYFLSSFKSFYLILKFIKKKITFSKIFYYIDIDQIDPLNLTGSSHIFTKKNLEKFYKNKNDLIFITDKKIKLNKRKQLYIELIKKIKKTKSEFVYDGNCSYRSEIISVNLLMKYAQDYELENYPDRFFYFYKKNNFQVEYVGTNHRIYNFNGSFLLPDGGRTIGDGGDVDFRLNFIPDLTNKTFLDIGTEEGYSVFNAFQKNASYSKGLNINEDYEYDYFPNYLRPQSITSRNRIEIENTINFLKKIYKVDDQITKKVSFSYQNIYNLKDEVFDFVFCFGVLYHLKNPYLAIENLFNITRETLIIETQGSYQPHKSLLSGVILEKDGFIRHSPNALKYLLLKAGFSNVEILFSGVNKIKLISNIVLKATK